MKKYIALAAACAVIIAGVSAVPAAVEAAVPVCSTVTPKVVSYTETITTNGSLAYVGQSDVTSSLPLVLSEVCVEAGDEVTAGDVIARVDRDATQAFIASLGNAAVVSAASVGISAAMSLIPDSVAADCSGRVITAAAVGTAVEAGQSIASIASTDTLVLNTAVSELDISKIKLGQQTEFTLSAYPDTVFSGTVAKISAAARSRYSGAVLETVVDVAITPDTVDERLCSGLTADVTFLLSDPRKICVLPYEAIGQDDEGEYIYVFEDNTAVKRKVFTGAEFSDGTEIIKGAAAGDRVLLNPENVSGGWVRVSE